MNRITATMKELVAEVIGDGNMFDKARQEKAMAAGSKGVGLNTPPEADPEPARQGMIPPPDLRPMRNFNPAEPAILHDAINDSISPGIGNVRTTLGRRLSTMLRGGSHGRATCSMDG